MYVASSCVHLFGVSVVDQQERAFRLGIAAILGDGVYNFGELVCLCLCVYPFV